MKDAMNTSKKKNVNVKKGYLEKLLMENIDKNILLIM